MTNQSGNNKKVKETVTVGSFTFLLFDIFSIDLQIRHSCRIFA
ncbi:hypothetical protein HMPREF1146_2284 [Prevotella sp. MSX73]|uniref:Uncharacterized protein n=1 Tax=Segatella buccae ATCC 33574 TaxID=873513 RepID=E6K354_9BACT|nr:hypothetical protein HMPREF6485_0039 [Segatella buccae ATCC 33574]EJP27935.1 hypothetical protein HMPREF1146_2284 [Prevotella sp. MSX73]